MLGERVSPRLAHRIEKRHLERTIQVFLDLDEPSERIGVVVDRFVRSDEEDATLGEAETYGGVREEACAVIGEDREVVSRERGFGRLGGGAP